VMRVCLSAE